MVSTPRSLGPSQPWLLEVEAERASRPAGRSTATVGGALVWSRCGGTPAASGLKWWKVPQSIGAPRPPVAPSVARRRLVSLPVGYALDARATHRAPRTSHAVRGAIGVQGGGRATGPLHCCLYPASGVTVRRKPCAGTRFALWTPKP